jgi:outer membrane protein
VRSTLLYERAVLPLKNQPAFVATAVLGFALALAGAAGAQSASPPPAANPAAAASPAATPADTSWMARVRVYDFISNNSSDSIPAYYGVPQNAFTTNSIVFPEVDFSYFFDPHIVGELMLSLSQPLNLSLSGTPIGTFRMRPAAFTVQYHFSPGATFQPYAGVGFNYTLFGAVALGTAGAGAFQLASSSTGFVANGGADIHTRGNQYFNVDVKWLSMNANLFSYGTQLTNIRINPLLVGLGYGIRY